MARRNNQTAIARTADRYDLYLRSVQNAEHEVAFFDRLFKNQRGRRPRVLREDFCGTFQICCQWARKRGDRLAIGVDLDPEPLGWGRRHNLSRIPPAARERVRLLEEDVRKVGGPKADIVAAQNFSFWIFKTRDEVRNYFRAIYRNLKSDGAVFLDMMGGPESMEENHTDRRKIDEPCIVEGSPKRFTYLWEQARFDPITHDASFYIHFEFTDGSKMKRAFEYHWRFWTIPEVRELLSEAGFRRCDVYWEGTDRKTGEGNEVYRRRRSAPGEPAWICYLVGWK